MNQHYHAGTIVWQIEVTSSVFSSNDGDKWHSWAFVSSTVKHNFSRRCHADDETHTHLLPWCISYSVSPRASLFVPREMCLPRQSPATAGARMRFRGLLSQSAFPIRLNALWRRGLLHDTILRVDKWSSMSQAGPHSWEDRWGWWDRQLGAQEMKGAHSLTDVLIKNS